MDRKRRILSARERARRSETYVEEFRWLYLEKNIFLKCLRREDRDRRLNTNCRTIALRAINTLVIRVKNVLFIQKKNILSARNYFARLFDRLHVVICELRRYCTARTRLAQHSAAGQSRRAQECYVVVVNDKKKKRRDKTEIDLLKSHIERQLLIFRTRISCDRIIVALGWGIRIAHTFEREEYLL